MFPLQHLSQALGAVSFPRQSQFLSDKRQELRNLFWIFDLPSKLINHLFPWVSPRTGCRRVGYFFFLYMSFVILFTDQISVWVNLLPTCCIPCITDLWVCYLESDPTLCWSDCRWGKQKKLSFLFFKRNVSLDDLKSSKKIFYSGA